MRGSAIEAHERSFFDTGIDSGGKKHLLAPFEVTVPGTNESVPIMRCTRENGDESFFYREEPRKKRIVLHFTMGYLKGDVDTLTKKDLHVSVPFIVARNGAIVNLWPSKLWSYHLGKNAQGGNEAMSRSSVAIEISNIGPLKKTADGMQTDYKDIYCAETEAALFTTIASPFREYTHFATFTDAQYDSVIRLLRFLTAKYEIPRRFLPPERRYGVVEDVADFRGITSHANYRRDKSDIGPAFDWDRVIAGVGAE